jgi:hypothetical protein
MVSLLLKLGKANLNATDNENRTPLHLAAWQGHSVIVRMLIEHGASVNHACNQGATALGNLMYTFPFGISYLLHKDFPIISFS